MLKLHMLSAIARSVFEYYSQVFLDECLYELINARIW